MEEPILGEDTLPVAPKDDEVLALAILVIAAVVVVIVGISMWRRNSSNSVSSDSWKQTSFTPPPERAEFIDSKEKFDLSKVSEMEELKKLLMRRAIKTIPILLSLQNEGSSIERLYKRGMLTDDMHFKVKELKAFVDKEFQDIQFEADELVEGWGQHIWPQAMQFHQMIQKQAESKVEEQRTAEEEKKKQANAAKKEKERAKKLQAAAAAADAVTAAASSSSSVPKATTATSLPPVITPEQEAAAKAAEAERMANLLLEEEEKEKGKSGKKGNKK